MIIVSIAVLVVVNKNLQSFQADVTVLRDRDEVTIYLVKTYGQRMVAGTFVIDV